MSPYKPGSIISSFFLKGKMFFTDPFSKLLLRQKANWRQLHSNIVKFSSRFIHLGLVLVDPQHFDNVMMRFYDQ